MKKIWIWYIPLFFLPNFGLAAKTAFGVIELSDFLLIGFVPMLYLAPKIRESTISVEIKKKGLLFLCWGLASIIWIYLYYDYLKPAPAMIFSFLKLAKFTLYATVGLMISKRLVSEEDHINYHKALLIGGMIMGLSLSILKFLNQVFPVGAVLPGFKATNLISVALAMILIYSLSLYLTKAKIIEPRGFATTAIMIMVFGSTYSAGRGGWLAAICGAIYILFKINIKLRHILTVIASVIVVITFYATNEAFQRQIDYTFGRDESYLTRYKIGVGGVDDGGRITTWLNELGKFQNSPVFGTGFYHRGAASGLWDTGSHNFWLQMFLETGLVGGFLILYLLYTMWHHAKLYAHINKKISVALRAAIITSFIGGLSGEYFYGGFGLLALMLIYAPVGASLKSDYKDVNASS